MGHHAGGPLCGAAHVTPSVMLPKQLNVQRVDLRWIQVSQGSSRRRNW